MATYDDGDIIRVTAGMSVGGGDIQNVYHVRINGTGSPDDQTVFDVVAEKLEAAYDEYNDLMSDGITSTTVGIYNVTRDEPGLEDAWPNFTGGVNIGDSGALQLAPLALFGTNAPRSQGRKYLPPLIQAAYDAYGYLDSGTGVAVAAFIAELLDFTTSGGVTYEFGNWNKALSRFARWVSGTYNSIVRTQRRRVPGVGS